MFYRLQMVFSKELFSWLRWAGRWDLQHPGAVGELVAQVQGGIAGGAGLPHFPDDLQPALAQAALRLGVALAALAQRGIIDRRP